MQVVWYMLTLPFVMLTRLYHRVRDLVHPHASLPGF